MYSTLIFCTLISIFVVACAPKTLEHPEAAPTEGSSSLGQSFSKEEFFTYHFLQDSITQDSYAENKITLNFQVVNSAGTYVLGFSPQNFVLKENQIDVSQFEVVSDNPLSNQSVDIVIALDTSSAAKNMVNGLKTQIQTLVANLQSRNIKPLLCLLTFTDHTEKKCDRFTEDNPATATNENLQYFLDDLAKVKITSGGDKEHNQLRALMDASKSPFRPNSQRIVFLATASGFHYAPKKEGDAKTDAPTYVDALAAISSAQVRVFALAPAGAGYDQKFESHQSLVDPIRGQYFSSEAFLKNKLTLQNIFDSIRDKLSYQYEIRYAEEKNPGLNPTLALKNRKFDLKVKDHPEYTVQMVSAFSNQPDGRPELKKLWRLSREAKASSGNNAVYLNGNKIENGFKFEKYNIRFDQAPPDGANLVITYDPANFRDSLLTRPIVMPPNVDLVTLAVKFNGIEIPIENLRMSSDSEGNLVLDPAILVFSFTDPYQIRAHDGLAISIYAELKKD